MTSVLMPSQLELHGKLCYITFTVRKSSEMLQFTQVIHFKLRNSYAQHLKVKHHARA